MARKYTKNIKLEFAYQKVFSNIHAIEKIPIHDVIILESGNNLPKSKMMEGEYPVYGGGGATENKHNNYNIDYNTVGIGRVGARCGCVFEIKSNSWVTDNALYIKSYDERFYLPYLKYFLSFSNLNQYANNAMQPVISKRGIKGITIPLIDINKQKDISVLLESIEFGRNCDIKGFEDVLNNVKVVDIWKNLVLEVDNQQTLLKKLRQSIIQEAIEGKLTSSWREQNTDVESTSILLDKIKAEKEQLVKEKKIKKQKALSPISDGEIPFDIPDGWEWCRVGQLGYAFRGKSPKYDTNSSTLAINQKCVRWGFVDMEFGKGIKTDWYDSLDTFLLTKSNDILVNSTGEGTIGRSAIVNDSEISLIYDSHVLLLRTLFNESQYVMNFINSGFGQQQIDDSKGAKSTKQTELGVEKLRALTIPLPPLEEQKEIVKKVEKLFSMCNELEEQINSSKTNTETLMQAVLKEAFEK